MIAWIVLGIVAGALAKLIMPGKDPGNWAITLLLGIGGAILGGLIAGIIPFIPAGEKEGWLPSIWSVVTATGGALILLILYRAFAARKNRQQ